MVEIKKNIKRRLNAIKAVKNLIFFMIKDLNKIDNVDFVFILPVYHTGGAERVHLNIVEALKKHKNLVIFTENSATKNFLNEFQEYSDIIEINSILSKKCNWVNALLSFFLIRKLNTSSSLRTIFGCNTFYYYSIIPKIKVNVNKIDLFHAFNIHDHREKNIISTVKFIDHRVLINYKALNDIKLIYDKYNIEQLYYSRLCVIGNGINFGNKKYFIRNNKIIKIGFVGRWSPEKRPHIFLEISKKINYHFNNVQFIMAGTGMKSNLNLINKAGISFLGELTSNEEMIKLYEDLTFILLPSEREGFPMVVMEAMACGVIPITTEVGGIGEHIKNNKNGVLINEIIDQKVITEFCRVLHELINNTSQREKLSKNAYDYAQANFGIDDFQKNYRNIFNKF